MLFAVELIAAGLGLLYVWLAARHNRLAWPAAFVSAGIYGYLLWLDHLPMQAGLHLFYMLMAIIGWYRWQATEQDTDASITRMSWRDHAWIIIGGSLLIGTTQWLLTNSALSQAPLLDSATTIFSLLVTWLVVQQKLENWLYWIVIDAVSCWLFLKTAHWPLAALYALYTGIAIYGYVYWRRQLKNIGC